MSHATVVDLSPAPYFYLVRPLAFWTGQRLVLFGHHPVVFSTGVALCV